MSGYSKEEAVRGWGTNLGWLHPDGFLSPLFTPRPATSSSHLVRVATPQPPSQGNEWKELVDWAGLDRPLKTSALSKLIDKWENDCPAISAWRRSSTHLKGWAQDNLESVPSSCYIGSKCAIFIFCSQLAKTRDREDQEGWWRSPSPSPERCYPGVTHTLSRYTYLRSQIWQITPRPKNMRMASTHICAATTDEEVFSSQNLFISAAYSFTSEISLLTQERHKKKAFSRTKIRRGAIMACSGAWSKNSGLEQKQMGKMSVVSKKSNIWSGNTLGEQYMEGEREYTRADAN